jgi:hypothetical protein
MVNPRDWVLIRELSSQWGISTDLLCTAAAQLGPHATIAAVHRLAQKIRDSVLSDKGTLA